MGDILGAAARHWLTLHSFTVVSGLAIYLATSHTLQLRRHPSAAIAWVISLMLVPYVALPLFLIFGRRKVVSNRPHVDIHNRAAMHLARDAPAAITQQLAAAMGIPPPMPYTSLEVHSDGLHALHALLAIVDEAERSVDVCTFIFGHDNVGLRIAHHLAAAVRRGIRVRLLVDGLGTYLGGRHHFKALTAAGVDVAFFVPPLRSTLRGRTNLRNHRKLAIADGQRFWSGGRNLAADYFGAAGAGDNPDVGWIDLSFDLSGTLAAQAQLQFDQDWDFATEQKAPARLQLVPAPDMPTVAQLIPSGPDQLDDTLFNLLVTNCFQARHSIMAVSPYFVPDPTLLMALMLAARRGVRVSLLLPLRSNHRLADLARHRGLRDLSMAGAHIYLLPRMIHAKAVIIDNDVAFVGSANLDERSLFLNYELMTAFYDAADIRCFARWLTRQIDSASVYRPKRPSVWREIGEGLLLWLAFQL